MAFFDRNRSSHGGETDVAKAEDDSRHSDGKFKMGPANTQRKMGDTAFQAAKDHIDSAASCARNGDEQAADFHVGMSQQYAALGAKNHLMGKYVDDTKGKTPMPVLAQAQTAARKAETEIARLQKNWDDRNAAHRGGEQDKK